MKKRSYLYSPWRLDYILSEKAEDCVFCRAKDTEKDEENLIVYRAKHCFVMLNRYPYNNGHIMVVPYQHESDIGSLDKEVWQEMGEVISLCEKAIKQVYMPNGINIGMNLGAAAGAGIAEHLHTHILPRWTGDNNFMSVVAGERVIPEPFEDTFTKLREALLSLSKNEG